MENNLFDIIKLSVGHFFIQMTVWTIAGCVMGLLLAFLSFLLFSAMGAFRNGHTGSLTIAAMIVIAMIMTGLLGCIGFYQGILKTSEKVLKSDAVRRIYLQIGHIGAEAVYIMSLIPADVSLSDIPTVLEMHKKKADGFRRGTWELDVDDFFGHLEKIEKQTAETVVLWIKSQATYTYPNLRDGIGGSILDIFADTFGAAMIRIIIRDQIKDSGVRNPMVMFTKGLRQTAAGHGNPKTLSYQELCGFIAEYLVAAPMIIAVKQLVRSSQGILLMITILTFVIGVIFFTLISRRTGVGRTAPLPPLDF